MPSQSSLLGNNYLPFYITMSARIGNSMCRASSGLTAHSLPPAYPASERDTDNSSFSGSTRSREPSTRNFLFLTPSPILESPLREAIAQEWLVLHFHFLWGCSAYPPAFSRGNADPTGYNQVPFARTARMGLIAVWGNFCLSGLCLV